MSLGLLSQIPSSDYLSSPKSLKTIQIRFIPQTPRWPCCQDAFSHTGSRQETSSLLHRSLWKPPILRFRGINEIPKERPLEKPTNPGSLEREFALGAFQGANWMSTSGNPWPRRYITYRAKAKEQSSVSVTSLGTLQRHLSEFWFWNEVLRTPAQKQKPSKVHDPATASHLQTCLAVSKNQERTLPAESSTKTCFESS